MNEERHSNQTRFKARRVSQADLPAILSLYESSNERTDGGVSTQPVIVESFYAYEGRTLVEVMETSSLSIVVEDENLSIVGFAVLDNYPAILEGKSEVASDGRGLTVQQEAASTIENDAAPSLVYHQWSLVTETHRIYQYNSLWFKCFISHSGKESRVLRQACQWILAAYPEINHLLLYVGKDLAIETLTFGLRPFLGLFEEIQGPAEEGIFSSSQCSIYHCPRERAFPPLIIRPATVEDHDDLVEVFDAQSDVVTDTYGEFFLAELIAAQDESHKSLVAQPRDSSGKAVGLMCVTTEVDVNVLVKCFHLEDYDFLLKPKFADIARASLSGPCNEGNRRNSAGFGPGTERSVGDRLQFTLELLDLDLICEALVADSPGDDSTAEVEVAKFVSAAVSALEDGTVGDESDGAERILTSGELQEALEGLFNQQLCSSSSSRPIEELTSTIDAFLAIDEQQRRDIGNALLAARTILHTKPIQHPITEHGDQQNSENSEENQGIISSGPGERRVTLDQISAALAENGLEVDSTVMAMVLTFWGGLPSPQDELTLEALDGAIMNLCDIAELPVIDDSSTVVQRKFEAFKIALPPSHDLWLADTPQYAKDVFCISMFCLDAQYQRQSADFLVPAFSMFPDKNYCILTQPHDTPQSNFLSSMFTQVSPKIATTFHHVLYLAHRDSVYARLSGSPVLMEAHNPHWEVVVLPHSSGQACLDWSRLEPVASTITKRHRESIQERYERDEITVVVVLLDGQTASILGVEMVTDADREADPIDTLRYCYDIDQYLTPAVYKRPNCCCRLTHWSVSPLLRGQTRRILHMANTALGTRLICIATTNNNGISCNQSLTSSTALPGRCGILDDEFIHVAPRLSLPGVTTIKRAPPPSAIFAQMDESDGPTARWEHREWIESEGGRQERLLRDQATRISYLEGTSHQGHEECESVKILTKSMILDCKCTVNTRIVVVGASDAGLAALAALISMPKLHFTSLTLLAPGGISYFLYDELETLSHQEASLSRLFKTQATEGGHPASLWQVRRLTATTGAFSPRELRRLMMDSRVRILDARMISLDRTAKTVSVVASTEDGSQAEAAGKLIEIPYDHLVLTTGLQDHALHSLSIRSMGVADLPLGYRHVNGCLSSADSSCDKILGDGSILLKSLMWNPLSYVVIYGRALDSYCAIQGLLGRLVPPEKIVLVLPPRRSRDTIPDEDEVLPVDAFAEGDPVEGKIHDVLMSIGVRVHSNLTLTGVELDSRQRLCAIKLSGLAGEEDKSEEPQGPRGTPVRGILEKVSKEINPDDPIQYKITCRVLITADGHSVDPRIFSAIYGNQLVYDGRLIVDRFFRTTDESIFAAGPLCEFSRRYVKAPASGGKVTRFHQSLRQDGYNGREVGTSLAEAIVKCLDPERSTAEASGEVSFDGAENDVDPQSSAGQSDSSPLPAFSRPHVSTGLLPGLLHYYKLAIPGLEDYMKLPSDTIVTDDLNVTSGTGHFCQIEVDKLGKISEFTYLGGEPLELQNLCGLLGMPVAYLNNMSKKCADGQVKAIIEYLEDNWAKALFHDRFTDLTAAIAGGEEQEVLDVIKAVLENDSGSTVRDKGVTDDLILQLEERLPPSWKESLKGRLEEFLRSNADHLPLDVGTTSFLEADQRQELLKLILDHDRYAVTE
ncbi:hypothetical protein FOZ61_009513 [Perkinsus olseni]|uniref:Cilia- and flagella-associated protein 61 N-terminal domain-containing protein n=1 Tax=Perkinsus olseni TaxID=32597 RepID=A0A7J6MHJ4_PEROL|nr:hypothetical protein FOZ61_009513 [Perkinsus olseni]